MVTVTSASGNPTLLECADSKRSHLRLMLASPGHPAGMVQSADHDSAHAVAQPAVLSEIGARANDSYPAAAPEVLIGIEDVQKSLSRSRASVYRYANTDPRSLNPAFNPRKLNPEYRSDQKDPLLFHPNEVARFARDVLRIKEVTVEVLNSPSTVTQQLLASILEELRQIKTQLASAAPPSELHPLQNHVHSRPAA
ncbi:MAG: resolvase [Synechococcaceae cyanobacterium]|nr:resolvase [Synechococcaceae cyanobacterium]